ncbi:MAG: flagellar assembly protein FliH, partial [Steroidobacteraceae bacterium]
VRAFETERQRGYEAGLAAARAEADGIHAELNARAARLDAMLSLLARPLAALDAEVQQQLTMLALAIGRQLARRELAASREEIIPLIRECIGRLPAAARDIRVHLHPQDAAIVREQLAAPAAERAWTIVEEPTQSRGGCLIRAEASQLDARLETRVNAIAASLFGEERTGERAAGAEPA